MSADEELLRQGLCTLNVEIEAVEELLRDALQCHLATTLERSAFSLSPEQQQAETERIKEINCWVELLKELTLRRERKMKELNDLEQAEGRGAAESAITAEPE